MPGAPASGCIKTSEAALAVTYVIDSIASSPPPLSNVSATLLLPVVPLIRSTNAFPSCQLGLFTSN